MTPFQDKLLQIPSRGMVALSVLAVVSQASVAIATEWQMDVSRDAMTDAASTFLVLKNDAGASINIGCIAPGKGAAVFLLARDTAFLGEGFRDLLVRFDDDPALRLVERYSDQGLKLGSREENNGFIYRVPTAHRIRIRFISYRGYEIDEEFFPSAGADKIHDVVAACEAKR